MSNTRFIPLEEIQSTQETLASNEPIHLHYFKQFTPQEIKALEVANHLSIQELEMIIQHHKHYFRLEYFLNGSSQLANLLFPLFLIQVGNIGIRNLARLINKDLTVSNAIAYGINVPLTAGDTVAYLLTFSAPKNACEATLKYALRPSLQTRIKQHWQAAQHNPTAACKNVLAFSANQLVLNATNATSTLTLVLETAKVLDHTPPLVKWSLVSLVYYLGIRYLINFTNGTYIDGLEKFWKNKQNNPWLIGELKRGNFALPIQITIQGVISAVLFRSIAFYLYLIFTALTELGFNIPKQFITALSVSVAVLSAWHSFCVWYPNTFYYYLQDEINLRKWLLAHINELDIDEQFKRSLETLMVQQLDMQTIQTLRSELIQKQIHFQKNILEKAIIAEHGQLYLFKKEKWLVLPMASRVCIGAGVAYFYLAPFLQEYFLDEPISTSILSIIIGATLFGGALYKAEKQRVLANLMLEKVEPKEIAVQSKPTSVCLSWLLSAFKAWLILGNNVSSFMSDVGTGTRILLKEFQTESYALNLLFTTISIEKTFNNYYLMKDKIENVLHGWLSPSRFRSTLFHTETQTNDLPAVTENISLSPR